MRNGNKPLLLLLLLLAVTGASNQGAGANRKLLSSSKKLASVGLRSVQACFTAPDHLIVQSG